ncbi:MAG TPA: glutamate synthase subunit alpha, partial [Stenomitos sp.]
MKHRSMSPQTAHVPSQAVVHPPEVPEEVGYAGQPWLVEERDACGVGFIVHRLGQASFDIVSKALHGLACVEHRGGCSADQDSGDGAGIMTAVPWSLLSQWWVAQGYAVPDYTQVGVGMVFLPMERAAAEQAKQVVAEIAQAEGFSVVGWRMVPVNPSCLGRQAKENQPQIEQVFLDGSGLGHKEDKQALERCLYLVRKRIEVAIANLNAAWSKEFYFCSLSSRTIVYKGMVRSAVLSEFYLDLQNPDFTS